MNLKEIPEHILAHFGIYEDDVQSNDDKFEIEETFDSGFVIRFREVGEIPETTDGISDHHISQMLEHYDDKNHVLESSSFKIEENPVLIASVCSSYDEAVDLPTTYRGIAWIGTAPDQQPPDEARNAIDAFVEDTLIEDFSWKLRLVSDGVRHVRNPQKRTKLVENIAEIIRRLSQ